MSVTKTKCWPDYHDAGDIWRPSYVYSILFVIPSDEILYEGSVVYEALLMALDERQGRSIVEAFEKFIRENSTITIMDQMFLLDDCTHCILSPRLQRKGKGVTKGLIVMLSMGRKLIY